MTPIRTRLLQASIAVAALAATGCIPYTVGSTGQTAPEGELIRTANAGFIIGGGNRLNDSTGASGVAQNLPSSDAEVRYGLSDRSDAGIRLTGGSGLVGNYKRRHAGDAHPDSAAFATMWGGGIVNWGQHAFFESTAILSGARRGRVTPYGGVRLMHVLPIAEGALNDTPTVGAFFGLRLGSMDFGVSPEIGVFYDESVTGVRTGNIVVVPAITISGFSFLPRLFR